MTVLQAGVGGWSWGGNRCFCTNNSLVSPMLWPAGAVASIKGNGFIGIWFQVTCEHCRGVDGSTVSSVHGCSSQNSSQGSARTCENTSFPQKYIFLFFSSPSEDNSLCASPMLHILHATLWALVLHVVGRCKISSTCWSILQSFLLKCPCCLLFLRFHQFCSLCFTAAWTQLFIFCISHSFFVSPLSTVALLYTLCGSTFGSSVYFFLVSFGFDFF